METGPVDVRGLRLVGGIVALAAAYVFAAVLGLQLAVPPGYATVVWPASGIAVAALLIFSPRLAPGVFIGSLTINAYVGHAFDAGVDWRALAVAAAIASGSTLQALAGTCLSRRLFGIPTVLNSVKEVVVFGGIVGPLACVIAASIGTGSLFVAGIARPEQLVSNWLTWWSGDLIGIFAILPLALLGPWRRWGTGWSRDNTAGLRAASVIALMVPLGMTFYVWKWSSEVSYERGRAAFQALTTDSEQSLLYRLQSYSNGLDGAKGMLHASTGVTAAGWRAYVDALGIGMTLPGISGIGLIDDVPDGELASYYARIQNLGVEGLVVHPADVPREHHFVIRYIEPLESNRPALGLDIAFEANRRDAAERARSSGKATITRRIFLVQDNLQSAGFLLLKPIYASAAVPGTVEERLAAFQGWVYAPFIGLRFMENLTSSQGTTLQIHIYDGAVVDAEQLIYSSAAETDKPASPTYTITKTIPVLGQSWTIVWDSTEQFDGAVKSNESLLVLLAGFLLSALFAVLMLNYARREEIIQRQVVQKTDAIAARERENRAIVDMALVGILLLDGHGKVISANEAARDIFGVPSGDGPELSIRDLLKIEPQQSLAEVLGEYVATRAARSKPASGVSSDGRHLDLDFQLNPWTTEDGQARYTAIVRDVTQQRQITVALEDAEKRWSIALRGARIGVFDIDLLTGQAIVSDTWLEMLGFAATDAVEPQAEWRRRVHPEDLPVVDAADAACFAGVTLRTVNEFRIRHCDGHWIWLRSDATVSQRDADGRALRLVGTQTDITALKETAAALRASEERLRSAIANAPIGMAMIDRAGDWISVNEAMFAFLGYSAEEFLQLSARDLSLPDEAGREAGLVAQLLSGEISHYQIEKRYLHKEGHVVWGLLSTSVARDEEGGIDYFIAQVQDIHHRKEMDRIKSEFISNVSHELRTPLTSIRGALGLVMGAMVEQVPEAMLRLLTIAHKNSERLILLINDILDLEKMNSEKLPFEIAPHGLVEEVVLAMDANQSFAAQFDVDFALDTPESDFVCDFDAARLQQVLSNLLSNAAKFSPRGGTVRLSMIKVGAMARVSVADSGVGIPASFRNRIFSPFSQADASATRETGGTGLGLHISKQMMERMSGALDYSSVEGSGSTFWIDLPLARVAAVDRDDSAGHHAGSPSARLPRLLHVEDDADFREFIASAIDGMLSITQAASLAQARKLLAGQSFDLILLDLQLPDGNGVELLGDLDQDSDRPVIVLTATEDVVDHARVRFTLVKSRTPEAQIVALILSAAGLSPEGEGSEAS